MIITSYVPLEINKIYNENNMYFSFKYLQREVKHYSIKIIKECTENEFEEYIYEEFEKDLADRISREKYFYEIQTD